VHIMYEQATISISKGCVFLCMNSYNWVRLFHYSSIKITVQNYTAHMPISQNVIFLERTA